MIIDLGKQDLINLLSSTTPNISQSSYLEKVGLMKWNGNQYNEDWKWNKEQLKELTKEEIYALYKTFAKKVSK